MKDLLIRTLIIIACALSSSMISAQSCKTPEVIAKFKFNDKRPKCDGSNQGYYSGNPRLTADQYTHCPTESLGCGTFILGSRGHSNTGWFANAICLLNFYNINKATTKKYGGTTDYDPTSPTFDPGSAANLYVEYTIPQGTNSCLDGFDVGVVQKQFNGSNMGFLKQGIGVYRNGYLIDEQTVSLNSSLINGSPVHVDFSGSEFCSDGSQEVVFRVVFGLVEQNPSARENILGYDNVCLWGSCQMGTSGLAQAKKATCDGLNTVLSNGEIKLSLFQNSDKYDYNIGSTYTGAATYASANAIPAGGVIVNNLPNPSGFQDYTVRVFGSDGCFNDFVVTLPQTFCPVPCVEPTGEVLSATLPTCTGTTSNNDATVIVTGVVGGDRVGISPYTNYTGPGYLTAQTLNAGAYTFTGLANPVSNQIYTVRIFNGAPDCYIDRQVEVFENSCDGCSKASIEIMSLGGAQDGDSTPGNSDPTEDDFALFEVCKSPEYVDLELTKSVSLSSGTTSDTYTYTLTLTNAGTMTATDVQVAENFPVIMATDTLVGSPATVGNGADSLFLMNIAASIGDFGISSGWILDSLQAGQSATLALDVRAAIPGTYQNCAYVTNFFPDNDPDSSDDNDDSANEDDDDCATITVTGPAVPSVTKEFSPEQANAMSPIKLTLKIVNPNATYTQLTAPLTDVFPTSNAGGTMMIAVIPNLITNLMGVNVNAGDTQITIPSGIILPPGLSTITVDVTVSGEGRYCNDISAGSLQTTVGTSFVNTQSCVEAYNDYITGPHVSVEKIEIANPNDVVNFNLSIENRCGFPSMIADDFNMVLPDGVVLASGSSTGTIPLAFTSGDTSVMIPTGTAIPDGISTIILPVTSAVPACYTPLVPLNELATTCGGNENIAEPSVNPCIAVIDSLVTSDCDPLTNTYDLTVYFAYTGLSGTDLTINGTTYTTNGSGVESYTITGLTANGSTGNTVTITDGTDSSCTVSDTYDAPANCAFCPTLSSIEAQQSGTTITSICAGESFDLKVTYGANTGDLSIFKGASGLTVAQLYDFSNHTTNGISAVNSSVTPVSGGGMSTETNLTFTQSSVTYYFILADGNTNTSANCQPMDSVTINSNSNPTAIPAAMTLCDDGDGSVVFDLTTLESPIINGQTNVSVNWFENAALTTAISGTSSYESADGAVYAQLEENTLGCVSPAVAVFLTVSEMTPTVFSSDQTICENGTPAAFTASTAASADGTLSFQWQSNTTGCSGAFANIAGATSEVYAPGALTTTTYYRLMVSSILDGVTCSEPSNCTQITVTSTPTATPAAMTICDDGDGVVGFDLTTLESTVLNGQTMSVNWYEDAALTTVITSASSYQSADATVYAQVEESSANCVSPSVPVTLTVSEMIPTVFNSNQTICENDTPLMFTASTSASGDGTLTYQWQSNTTGCSAAFADIAGATFESYAPGALTATTYYRLMVTSTLNGVTCSSPSNCTEIIVNPNPNPTSATMTLCDDGDGVVGFDLTTMENRIINGETNVSVNWYENAALTTAITSISNYQSADATIYAQVVENTTNCVSLSIPVALTVSEIIPSVFNSDQSICENETPMALTASTPATADGVLSFQWQSNTTGCSDAYVDIAGATTESYAPSALTTTTYYRLMVTTTLSGVTCASPSNCTQITVNPNPTSVPAAITLCDDGDGTVGFDLTTLESTIINGQSNMSVNWYSNAALTAAITSTSSYQSGDATVYAQVEENATNCVSPSVSVALSVSALVPTVFNSDQSICENDTPTALTAVTPASADGTLSFQWQSNTTGCGDSFVDISGATSESYAPGALTTDTYFRLMVTSTLNGVTCTLPSNCTQILVTPKPTATPTVMTLCDDGDGVVGFDLTTLESTILNGQTNMSVNWYSNAALTTAITSASNYQSADGTVYAQVEQNTLGCLSPSVPIALTVIEFTPAVFNSDQSICEGDTPVALTPLTSASGDGTRSFQWQSSTTNCATGFSDIPGATSESYAPGALTTTTYYRLMVIPTQNGVSCISPSNCTQITVNPNPTAIPAAMTLCDDGDGVVGFDLTTLESTIINGQSNMSVNWYEDAALTTAITSASNYQSADGTVYAQVEENSSNCLSPSVSVSLTVLELTATAFNSDQTICENDTPAALTASTSASGDGTLSFQWQSNTVGCTATYTDIAGATLESYAPAALTATTYYRLMVTTTLNGASCTLPSNCTQITVNPNQTATPAAMTLCDDGDGIVGFDLTTLESTIINGQANVSVNWYEDAALTTAITSTSNYQSADATVYAQVEENATNCVSPSVSVVLTVSEFVATAFNSDQSICENDTPTALTASTPASGDGTLSFQWQTNATGCAATYTDIAGATSESYAPAALTATTYYRLMVTTTLNGVVCTLPSNCTQITVNPNPSITPAAMSVCDDGDGIVGFDLTTLENTIINGQPNMSVNWFENAALTTAITSPANYQSADGSVYAQVENNTTSCKSSGTTIALEVIELTPPVFNGDQVICEGNTPSDLIPTAPSVGDGTLTFQWQLNHTGCSAVFIDIPGATTEVYSPPSIMDTTYYRLVVTSTSNGVSCSEFSNCTEIIVNPVTGSANVDMGPHDLCSENSPLVPGIENVVDLNTFIISGQTNGTWTTTNPTASANLNGSIFTAAKSLEGQTINFYFVTDGTLPGSGTACDDNSFIAQITVNNCYASLGNIVWEDKNGNGIQDDGLTGVPGVTVELYECLGGVKGTKIDFTVTNSNGGYLFDQLPSGEYCVKFDLTTSTHPAKDDFDYTVQNSSTGDDTNDSDASPLDGCTSSYTVNAGDSELNVDAGVYIPAKLGDYVWEDTNYNGVQDAGEPGIENVIVTLTGTDGSGIPIAAQTTTTDNTGMYMFGDLDPGDYKVTFSQPVGYEPTENNDPSSNGNDDSDSDADPNMSLMTPIIPVESGDTIPNVDAGFVVLSKLGDLVWEDTNGNGIQDGGEPGIQSVDVTLTGNDGLGNPIVPQTITTDANGMYMFGDLYPGDYVVTFGQPTGYEPTSKDDPSQFGDDEDDSDADPNNNLQSDITTIVSGDTIPNVDAGFVILSKLGDLVWEDDNYNGVQDAGEPGIPNSIVTLTGTDGLGNPITAQTTQTNGTGMYMFGDLWPGTYTVTFSQPTNMVPTTLDDPNNNGDDEDDSDADPTNGLQSPPTVIVSGDTIPTIDAGFVDLVQLGNLVWEDTNYNGIQDPTEPRIENVTVTLSGTDGMGNAVNQTLQTNAVGEYCFTDLFPGDYSVAFGLPVGYVPTVLDDPKTNGDDTDDSDANPNNNLGTIVHTLTSGDDNKTLDAGFIVLSKLGDVVWEDMNYNGVQDAGEPGIGNVTVTLNGTNGLGDVIATQTQTTDSNGMYMFGDLYPGDYTLTFSQPSGYEPTVLDDPKTNGDDTDDSDADPNDNLETIVYTLGSGDTIPTIDAGFVILSKLGDFVWMDLDYNGVQDIGEPGIENVVCTLTGTNGLGDPITPVTTQTDGTGMYMFGDLYPGDYVVTFAPSTPMEPTVTDDPNNNGDDENDSDIDPINLTSSVTTIMSGDTIPNVDAGFISLSELGNLVWEDINYNGVQDAGEPGIPNVTVTLTGMDGLGNPIMTQTMQTNAAGEYCFTNLQPGEYMVTFEQPAGYVPTVLDDPKTNGDDTDDSDADLSNNLTTIVHTIISGERNKTLDAGFVILSKLGDVVWEDVNYNGVQDAGEPGIGNVTVTLNGTNGLGDVIATQTQTTDSNGMYMFGDLYPGDYTLTFSQPSGYEPTVLDDPKSNGDDTDDSDADPNDNLETIVYSLTSGDTIPTIDAGFVILSKLGDVVWEDVNYNGVQDAGEPGIGNVTVTLNGTNGLGDVIATQTQTTDSNGMYMFSDLYPGDYTLTFSQPSGYEPTVLDDPKSNGDDTDDSDADPNDNLETIVYTLGSGDTIPTIDAGFVILSKLGDVVWEDVNYNGVQDAGEPGIGNVTVTLNGTNGLGDVISQQTQITDSNGMYMFGDLYPGDYTLTFSQPSGYEPTVLDDPKSNGDDTDDSDADPTDNLETIVYTLGSGDTIPTIDAGFVILSKLGDVVWEDVNYNGVQDAGEPGIDNVSVTLNGTNGLGDVIPAQTQITDSNGMYMFGDLYPGDYTLTFSQPSGYEPTVLDDPKSNGDDTDDSDADPTDNLETIVYTLGSGDTIPTIDAGFVILSKLGDFVWEDQNFNGVQDIGEPGIGNIVCTLTGTDGLGDPIAPITVQTDGTGMYMFGDLYPGDYVITFTPPTGMMPTATDDPNGNGDDDNDSDIDPTDLTSPVTNVMSGDTIPNIDCGFVGLSELGNLVWEDLNYNGVQDAGEPGIPNVTVTLTGMDGLGNPIMTQTMQTNGVGEYCFTNLQPGDYMVTFEQPTGYVPTVLDDPKSNGDDTDDSDADLSNNLTTIVHTIISGERNKTLDAGFVVLSKLGDVVWEDVNYNGVQDAGEPGIGNVTVTLNGTNGLGDVIVSQTQTTDSNGMYMFGDLYPGDYTLTFSQPSGYEPTVLDDPKSNGDDTDDSDADPSDNLETIVYTLGSGDTIPTIDAGFVVLSKLGDFVWEDQNFNGVQDIGEPGIGNVVCTLTGTDGLGDPIAPVTVQTDGTGMYMFGDLYPGDYVITFTPPTDMLPTVTDDPNGNGDDDNDSDIDPSDLTSPVTNVMSGDTIPNIDCGFVGLSELGNLVWEDLNYNGVQDAGELGIPNVTVTLTGMDGLGNPIMTQTMQTNGVGEYCFTNLQPGDYMVTFEQPAGYVPTVLDDPKSNGDDTDDSDADPSDNLTTIVHTIVSGERNKTLDAGFVILSKLGDVVWEDVNYNGVQDAGEPGIGNVTVTLNGMTGLDEVITQTQTTDASGMYMFGDLYPGDYTLTFSQPSGYEPTVLDDPKSNGDDTDDSDADPNDNLETIVYTLGSGDTIPTIDAGFVVLSKIGDFVWQDYDADGVQDSNEDPFENVNLTLSGTDNMDNPVTQTVTTDENGNYCFTDLYPGTYVVTCSLPTDVIQTIVEEPSSNEEEDSDFDPITNQTTPLVIVSGDTIPYVDCGFFAEDLGDAPNTFETMVSSNGPRHVIQPGKYLGTGVDAELEGSPEATSGYTGAGGDDHEPSSYQLGTNPTGDENGVNFITPMIPGHEACIQVTTTALSGDNYLTAWIDFSGNGIFDTGEQLLWKTNNSTTPDLLVANGVMISNYCFDVPADATFDGGETHARFRLSCETGVQSTGRVIGGEVEDYYMAFAKIGNLVWRDYEFEGDQDEPTYDGFNGVEVQLVWEGLDGILGNADDVTYSTSTAETNGENGKYCFFGAVPGDYTVRIPTIPAGFEPTQSDMTGDENNDSDGIFVDFTIADDFNLPVGENGMTDNPTGHNYPDTQDNLQFDFGFIAFDYGDLPAGFPTKDADTEEGAHHSIIPCMYLGDAVDSEEDGANDAFAGTNGAGGDDNTPSDFIEGILTGTSDEDGVEFITPLIPGSEAKIKVTAKAPVGGAVLNAWIDFNGDGDFINDPTEQVVFTKTSTSVINSQDAAIAESAAPVDYIFCFEVPADATFDGGETHARFRISQDGAGYDGFAVGGEVEDYWIPFAKVGNYVWYDANHNGLQDEPNIEGHNNITITLTWAGVDETLGTGDDLKFTTVSATDEFGEKGKYCFVGLQGGEQYSLEATVPDGFVITKETTTGVDDNDSNSPVIVFTMPDDISDLPVGENGTGDHPGVNGFADNNDDLRFDFGIVAFDFGDLPDEFKTTSAEDGAYHVINKGMYLGTCVDSDVDGAADAQAGFDNVGGDDAANSAYFEGTSTSDDEDGFRLISPMIPGSEACVEIISTMPIGTDGIVNLFIDFNGDGDFDNDANETVYFTKVNNNPMGSNTNGTVAAGENVITEFCFTVPVDATFEGGETHVRLRLSPSGFLSCGGEAIGGEVEDYYIPMAKVGSLAWLDYNDDGIQNEPADAGYNGLKIELTAPGSDAILGTADDIVFETYTADNDSGQPGTWEFCGLPEGDYQVEINPTGFTAAKEGVGSEDQDSDPHVVPFTIGHTADGLLTDENGMNEDPNGSSFPDDHNLLSIDFGLLAYDFGDIPDGFETLLSNNGARHVVRTNLYMGSCVDIEADANTDYQGGEGPLTGGDNGDVGLRVFGKQGHAGDEDGIRLLTPMIPGDTAVLEVRYSTPVGQDAYLNAFIDFDGDDGFIGDVADAVQFLYDENAHARSSRFAGRGALEVTTNPLLPHGIDNTCKIKFLVPKDATFHGGDVHLRFRLSTEGELDYNGIALDGEVEDYWFPVACAGNWVWFDQDKEGDQNESADLGMNDFEMYLETPGLDGVFGTADDFRYYQNTTTKDGIDGRFDFCGLIEGTYRIGYDEYPNFMIPTIPGNVPDDNMDSGGLFEVVSISKYADNSPIDENGMVDNMPDPNDFPDNQVNSSIDFGFVMDPVLGSSLAIQGVDFAESGTCGQFNATYDVCFEAFEVTDLNNLRLVLDFAKSDALGNAFIGLVKVPEVIKSTATTLPNLNVNYDGENDVEMFDGLSGLLEKGQKICYRLTIEIDPELAVGPMLVQALVEGGAVNDSGVEVPDLVNGGQAKESDYSDSGTDPSTSNPNVIGDTGGMNDHTPVSDCWESSTSPVCNNHITVTLDGDGQAVILGDHINEALNAPCDDGNVATGRILQN